MLWVHLQFNGKRYLKQKPVWGHAQGSYKQLRPLTLLDPSKIVFLCFSGILNTSGQITRSGGVRAAETMPGEFGGGRQAPRGAGAVDLSDPPSPLP